MRSIPRRFFDQVLAYHVGDLAAIRHQRTRRRALAACKRHKARLIIAKLDRLSRNLVFIAALMDAGAEFIAADNPNANKLTLHILAALAQHEREMIGERTRAALQAVKLGAFS